jgi:hypothetical protein
MGLVPSTFFLSFFRFAFLFVEHGDTVTVQTPANSINKVREGRANILEQVMGRTVTPDGIQKGRSSDTP